MVRLGRFVTAIAGLVVLLGVVMAGTASAGEPGSADARHRGGSLSGRAGGSGPGSLPQLPTGLAPVVRKALGASSHHPRPARPLSSDPQQKLPPPEDSPGLFGYSVALSADGGVALISAPDSVGGSATYVFVRSRGVWTLQQELLRHGLGNAFAVALSADGRTALIGSTGDFGEHAAYVFVRGFVGGWIQLQRLQAGAQGEGFGDSLSLSPDGRTALIGAAFADEGRGAAYVFTRGFVGGFTLRQRLQADDRAADDNFGSSVSLDTNGLTALIGAPGKHSDTGAAYVFTRGIIGPFTQQQRLQAADGDSFDGFGGSVSLSGSGSTALIGAPGTQFGGTAYVFARGFVGGFAQKQALQGASGDGFGASVSLSPNGLRALIGAPGHHFTGAAYVFGRPFFGSFSQRQVLEAELPAFADVFGLSVSLSADGATALIGAPGTDASMGAAYVFEGLA
jgi:hypothetical protein